MNIIVGNNSTMKEWNYIYLFIFVLSIFAVLVGTLFNLTVVRSAELQELSASNSINLRYIYPNRGLIYDRNGNVLAENRPSTDLYLYLGEYLTEEGDALDIEAVDKVALQLEEILGEKWRVDVQKQQFESLSAKIDAQYDYINLYPELREFTTTSIVSDDSTRKDIDKFLTDRIGNRWLNLVEENGFDGAFATVWRDLEDSNYQFEAQIATALTNEQTIKIKSIAEDLSGLRLNEGSERYYPAGIAFSHILGYTSAVTYEDWEELDYIGLQDIVGRLGVERVYDEKLIGKKGLHAFEVDALGNPLSESGRVVEEPISGESLYLTIDEEAQNEMYQLLKAATSEYNATGAAGIIQDNQTGEILVLASYPSYNNNLFIEGISDSQYKKLTNPSNNLPLLNRAVSAQLPPGSTFKTIAAVGALDSGAITTSTVYISRRGYTFSNGAGFQEYHNNAYGALDIYDAISVSSNIYFCETVRNWDIDEYVSYLEKFGIGSNTGIDITGEVPGRLPSPENKIALASDPNVTWLDPIWYPEGDACNTVIGQGITLVTPIQMTNWISAIANGGTLLTPHVAKQFESADGSITELQFNPIHENIASENSFNIVKEGMREAVWGSRATIFPLKQAKVEVAAKTGTAEFGALNASGEYEHTHAWVTGFWPYDNPKYTFTILLEDGGQSYNSAYVANDFINWWLAR